MLLVSFSWDCLLVASIVEFFTLDCLLVAPIVEFFSWIVYQSDPKLIAQIPTKVIVVANLWGIYGLYLHNIHYI